MKIAIIGCGNMGMAFARAFRKFELVKEEDFLLVEKNQDQRNALTDFQSSLFVDSIDAQIASVDLIILAVKPQDFASVQKELSVVLKPEQIVFSIMAGIPISLLQSGLSHQRIVRAMPNTPAMLGMGITAYAAAPEVSEEELKTVGNLINATGESVFLDEEDKLDAVTAVSGSGPAYYFYFVKAMVDAGKAMGFEESVALRLVKQTMLGSYHLIQNTDKSLDDLIKAVASKGGTTEAALNHFNQGELDKIISGGLFAAQKRAKELSKG
jgi:pyrroline-5-carboxylate reductase